MWPLVFVNVWLAAILGILLFCVHWLWRYGLVDFERTHVDYIFFSIEAYNLRRVFRNQFYFFVRRLGLAC